MRRHRPETIAALVRVSGLVEACRGAGDLIPPLTELAHLSAGLYLHDKARVYTAAIDTMDLWGRPVPDITEDLFFDTLTTEIAYHYGQAKQEEGGGLRTPYRPLDEQARSVAIVGLEEKRERNPVREPGGRARRDRDVADSDPVQAHEEAEPVPGAEGSEGGGSNFPW